MIEPLSLHQAHNINFSPVAAIAAPAGWFKEQGVEFVLETDDLDEYEFAGFRIPNQGAFALMHYLHAAAPEMTLMLPETTTATGDFTEMVTAVAKAFRLPMSAFHWRVNGEPASFPTEPPQPA